MSLTRREVLEALAALSDADARRTTTVDALAAQLGVEVPAVVPHVETLAACELARRRPGGGVRVTVTGEQFLELELDDLAVVDPVAADE